MHDPKTYRHDRRRARERKVLDALRAEGWLREHLPPASAARPRRRVALALAAGLLLSLASGATGFRLGQRAESTAVSSPSVRMQQSGDAYVRALRELLEDAASLEPGELAQGREAALAVMLSGAAALSETLPDPAVLEAINQLRASRGTLAHGES